MLIRLSLSHYRCFPTHPPAEFVIGDGVTAFIGENNAGKSAAMRVLHDLRPLFLAINSARGLSQLIQQYASFDKGKEVRDHQEIKFNGNSQGTMTIKIGVDGWRGDARPNEHRRIRLVLTHIHNQGWRASWEGAKLPYMIDDHEQFYNQSLTGQNLGDAAPLIGALRALAGAVYIPAGRHLSSGGTQSFDAAIGDGLIEAWNGLQSGLQKDLNEASGIVEDSLDSLFGLSGLRIIPTAGKDQGVQFRIARNGQFRSDEMGTGLAQVFTALHVAVTKKPSLILIDEPELSLHPAVQLRFLAELQKFASVGVVFSTHSLGLAMNAAERIYAVKRHPGEPSTQHRPWSAITEFNHARELPSLLSVLSYPTYGDPAHRDVLLVEGPSDVIILQPLLEKLKIAGQVVLLHMGGGTTIDNLEHAKNQLAGLKRLCPHVWCLIDSESAEVGKLHPSRQAFLDLCKDQQIEAHATARRAIENYLSDAACKFHFGPAARALQPTEKLSSEIGWMKREAWKAVHSMEPSDFADVHAFLSRIAETVQER